MEMRKITFLIVFALASTLSFAQIITEEELKDYTFKEKFEAANTFMMIDQNYDMALPIWENLIKEQPDNYNLNYKLGHCLLRIYHRKSEALPYLEKAAKGITKNYSPYNFEETNSPKEMYYYLGEAYHLDYQLDKAQEAFDTFKKSSSKKHILQDDADLQIAQCDNAKYQIAHKRNYIIKNVGDKINGPFEDFAPVTTADDNVLFFTSRRIRKDSVNSQLFSPQDGKHFEDVYVAYRNRETGIWDEPTVLGTVSNPKSNQATISVTVDGSRLFVYVDDEGDGNIYVSDYDGEEYGRLVKLDDNINTSDWETHATVSLDGSTIYFVSDKEGGYGGRDIYQATLLPDGTWSKPQNLGPTINTEHDEDSPFFHPDDQTLFFSSNGITSMGGFDIFYSHLKADKTWTNPTNIGYPLNTVDDDVFLVTNPSGKRGYYSSAKAGGYGDKDIYEVYMDTSYSESVAILKGYIIEDSLETETETRILVSNLTTGEGPDVYRARAQDGGYIVVLKPCDNYLVEYIAGKELFHSENVSVPCDGGYYELEKIIDRAKDKLVLDSSEMESTKIDSAEYKKYFEYNKIDHKSEIEKFKKFIEDTKAIVGEDNMIRVTIEGSASRVPTQTWGNNFKLANARTEEAKKIVIEDLKAAGINMENVIIETRSAVQGPKYEGDFKDTGKYGVFQYVKLTTKLLQE